MFASDENKKAGNLRILSCNPAKLISFTRFRRLTDRFTKALKVERVIKIRWFPWLPSSNRKKKLCSNAQHAIRARCTIVWPLTCDLMCSHFHDNKIREDQRCRTVQLN